MENFITDKRLLNKRFRKTEEAIILAFFAAKEKICPGHIIKIAGISRATLYRHHHSLYEVALNYRKYILKKHQRMLKSFDQNNLAGVFRRQLVFLSVYHILISFLLQFDSENIIEQMITELKTIILNHYDIKNYHIYTKEVAGVIEEWGMDGFQKNDILPTVDKIMYLTKTAPARLNSFNMIQ